MRLMRDAVRYGAASLLALALDYGVLLFLAGQGVGYLKAAAGGFLCGLALIYMLSVRYVFEGRRSRAAYVEILGFLITGIFGLILTEILMSVFVGEFGLPLALAKAPTAALNFLFNFLTRRALLFKERPSPPDRAAFGRNNPSAENVIDSNNAGPASNEKPEAVFSRRALRA